MACETKLVQSFGNGGYCGFGEIAYFAAYAAAAERLNSGMDDPS